MRRRHLVRVQLSALLAAVLTAVVVLSACTASPNPVVAENRHRGTTAWQLGLPGFQVADDVHRQIEGYASATSVAKGGRIDLHVSVDHAQTFTADVYRTGWYGGSGGRLVTSIGPRPGEHRSDCAPAPSTGLTECSWPVSLTLAVPTSWTSGVYLVLLTNADKFQRYVVFVVRDDARRAAFLYQQSVTTYQAYNNYPADGASGKSLYDFNSAGSNLSTTGTRRAAKVSFDRPYADGEGSGQFAGSSGSWERYFVGWLERSGYDVTYSTDVDTASDGARLLDVKGFLSVGHDEYWSKSMVDAATRARESGVNLGFFGSNTAYWQVRFEPSSTGVENRVVVCYKNARTDPVSGSTSTVGWRDPPVERPEQSLVGVQYTAHLKDEGRGALYVVKNSTSWVWEGTGLSDGSTVPGIVGYETDRSMPGFALPVSSSYTLLSESPVVDATGRRDVANSSVYQAPSGAWVFATGTNHWSYGLGKPGVEDPRVQRATANVLHRFLSTPPAHAPALVPPSQVTAVALSASVVVLRWSGDVSQDASYSVERRQAGRPDWDGLAATLPAGTETYRDTTAVPSSTYTYRIRAEGGSGQSSWSEGPDVTTLPAPLFAEGFGEPESGAWSATSWDPAASDGTLDVRAGTGRMTVSRTSADPARATARMRATADSDTMASVRFGATSPRGFFYVFSRASEDWVRGYPRTSYFLRLLNDDTNLQLWSSHQGVTKLLASADGGGAVGTGAQWVRLRVRGDRVSAKVWSEAASEPRGWQVSATDSSVRGPGLLHVRWVVSEPGMEDVDVYLDDVEVRRP